MCGLSAHRRRPANICSACEAPPASPAGDPLAPKALPRPLNTPPSAPAASSRERPSAPPKSDARQKRTSLGSSGVCRHVRTRRRMRLSFGATDGVERCGSRRCSLLCEPRRSGPRACDDADSAAVKSRPSPSSNIATSSALEFEIGAGGRPASTREPTMPQTRDMAAGRSHRGWDCLCETIRVNIGPSLFK